MIQKRTEIIAKWIYKLKKIYIEYFLAQKDMIEKMNWNSDIRK